MRCALRRREHEIELVRQEVVAPHSRVACPAHRRDDLIARDWRAVRCEAHDRKRLEQVCRHITRPARSDERVQCNAAGQVELKLKTPWRDGTTHKGTPPLEFMQRLAALIPRPRLHLIRFTGCWRRMRGCGRWWCRKGQHRKRRRPKAQPPPSARPSASWPGASNDSDSTRKGLPMFIRKLTLLLGAALVLACQPRRARQCPGMDHHP